jgi:hypothetical protein
LLLLKRGVKDKSVNAVAHYRLRDLRRLMKGARSKIKPTSVRRYYLGDIDGIALGFTDAAAVPSGGWLFTAVAEDTDDSVADGACKGSVIGFVDSRGDLLGVHRLKSKMKVEGIGLQAAQQGLVLCLVKDSDTPARPSALLLAHLNDMHVH